MTEPITITVHGQPAPQGSKRAFAVRGKGGVPTGRVAVIESSHDRVKSWRQAVIDAALEAAEPTLVKEQLPLTGPLAVTMVFFLKRPQGHYRTGRNAHLLRGAAPIRPIKPPDTSKLVRSTEDALTDAGIWGDDAQVVDSHGAKAWAAANTLIGGHVYGLTTPGAIITIRQVTG